MAQAVTPSEIKNGFECFYRCDECSRNVYENYQFFQFAHLVCKDNQNKSKCPYCGQKIEFDLSGIWLPTDYIPPTLKYPGQDYSFVFKTNQSVLNTISLTIRGILGKTVDIYWGDQVKDVVTLTGSNQGVTHDYSSEGVYYISVLCQRNILKTFYLQNSSIVSYFPILDTQTSLYYIAFDNNNFTSNIPSLANMTTMYYFYVRNSNLTGSIPSLTGLTKLQRFYVTGNVLSGSIPDLTTNINIRYLLLDSNQLTGSIPSLNANTKAIFLYFASNLLTGSIPTLTNLTTLQRFYCHSNQLTGSIPSLTLCISLTNFYFFTNQISNYTASTLALTLRYFWGQNNLLTSSAVNQILADFVTNLASRPSTGKIYLHGTGNQAPTGQGIIDKAAIQAHGWTVNTN